MNVKQAAQRTVDSCVNAIPLSGELSHPEWARVRHLRSMNEAIQCGAVTGERAHRWLGWLQAVAYLRGGATPEQLQRINAES